MTSLPSRLFSAALAAVLALSAPVSALAEELPASPGGEAPSASLLEITVPDYTPGPGLQAGDVSRVQKGGLYTLIVLPASFALDGSTPKDLTAGLLTAEDPDSRPLYIGSAVAADNGNVTFTGIRLRTSEAAVYYVTGPGLEGAPLVEATGRSASLAGRVTFTPSRDPIHVAGASVSLVDKTTGYAYSNSVLTASDGSYALERLSPGEYFLHVEKPGFLPFTSPKAYRVLDDEAHVENNVDLSAYIGDVNGDGARTMSDLTALLSCYGKAAGDIPDGLTPDLHGDGQVNVLDAALLLGAMVAYDKLPAGVGTPDVNSVSLTARDVTADGQTDRTLRLSLNNGGDKALTFTAASFSLTFRTDYVQPLNQNGGVIHPGSGSVSCLVPKSGVTVSDARWSVRGDLATLTFSLSCAKPTALTDLVDFRYRPAPGKTTDQFFQGVFSVDHAAALVGQTTILTRDRLTLEYPNSTPLELTSITVDLADATLTIPSAGHYSLTLPLTATGLVGQTPYPDLAGVTWTLEGDNTAGVSISDSLLLITSDARPGDILLTASRDGVSSAPVTLTLKNADPEPRQIRILQNGEEADSQVLVGDAGEALTASYTAQVTSQYGDPMPGAAVTWTLSGAPTGISVDPDSGVLTADPSLPAGTYTFSLHASLNDLRAAVDFILTLTPRLHHLVLSGPTTAQIPSGSGTLTLSYLLSAIDAQGNVIPMPSLEPTFTVTSDGETAGVRPEVSLNGDLTVTVSPDAAPGDYTLRAADGDLLVDLVLTLNPPQEESTSTPARAAIMCGGEIVSSKQLTLLYQGGGSKNVRFDPVLLDANGNVIRSDDQRWHMAAPGLDLEATGLGWSLLPSPGGLEIEVGGAKVGAFFFTVSATEETSGLSTSIPVELTFLPDIGRVELSAPQTLTIPASGSISYPIGLTCYADDAVIAPPGPVAWTVSDYKGVTVEDGVLTVTSSATPAKITVRASCYAPDSYRPGELVPMCQGSCTIDLVSAGTEKVLVLTRNNISSPGSTSFTGGVDAIYGKEGRNFSLQYFPVLRNPATGEEEQLTEGVTWVGLPGSFAVDNKAEPGTYTAPITAIYQGQTVSLTASITVYPDITGLFIDFDEGDAASGDESYSFPLPTGAAKTYHGALMAKITRNSRTQSVPLADLGLDEYYLDLYTPLTGVYLAYDRATGRVALTIEPVASSNSMEDPGVSSPEIRYLGIDFSYYPDQELMELEQSCFLTKASPVVTTAILRQGSGAGSKFVFESARGETAITAAAGVMSDCFAVELLDQYGDPVLNQYVHWDLTGSPLDGSGQKLITCVDPSSAVTSAYPRYQSIRRLRISPDTPIGETYRLTLTAGVGATKDQAVNNPTFTRSIDVALTVDAQQSLASLAVSGPDAAVIPKWYVQYNSSATNSEKRELSYVAVAQDPNGNELDASLCTFAWKVTDRDGDAVDGVTISPDKDNPAAATVTVDRHARPTAKDAPLSVTVTATPAGDVPPTSASAPLSLSQGNLVPTLMTIKGPSSIKLDLPKEGDTSPSYPNASETYTFTLVNQYNDPVAERDAKAVKWSVDSSTPSFVRFTQGTDAKGHPSATLNITNPKKDQRARVNLTAQITFPEASTASGRASVYCVLPITITVGDPPSISGGDLLLEEEITQSTVTPATSKSGTAGVSTLSKDDVDVLTKTTATGTLTIAPKNTSGLTSITVTFPASVGKAIAAKTQNQSLRIQTAIGTVTLPKTTLSGLSNSSDVSVIIENRGNSVSVTFRRGSSTVSAFSSGQTATFSAPVKGEVVTAVSGGVSADVMQKTVISGGTLTVTLTGTAQLTLGARGKVFSDMSGHWAKSAVDFVVQRGLFQGTSETTFSPNGDMTRSMVVTVLHRLENTPAAAASNIFRDVPGGTWYTDAVVWANSKGIVQGNGDGFLPNDPVTREQLAAILYRYMKSQGYDATRRSQLTAFSDRSQVSSWAQEAMEWAVATGLITGKGGGILDPGGKATRAEVATMLERLVLSIAPAAQ